MVIWGAIDSDFFYRFLLIFVWVKTMSNSSYLEPTKETEIWDIKKNE